MKVTRVEKHRIVKQNEVWKIIDELCFKSKNVYNFANYIVRQEFITSCKEKEKGNWIRYNQLANIVKDSEPYKKLGSNVGQQTLRVLDKNWKSFFESIKDWSKNKEKYKGMPRLPKYLDINGRFLLGISNEKFQTKDGYIRFSWKPLKQLNNKFKTTISNDHKLMQCRFVPKGNSYVMEVVYEIEIPELKQKKNRIVGIDMGLTNIVTIVNNIGEIPIIIKGGALKSINQYYNKEKAEQQSELKLKNNKHWSNNLDKLQRKRDNKIDDYMHKASRVIVNWCEEHDIDTVVIGKNKGWKQDINIGKKNNQNFVSVPTDKLIHMIGYKLENIGIECILNEESYTSKASFLDEDFIPTYGKKGDDKIEFSGKRIQRGLYESKDGTVLNADVNGAYNIIRKAVPNAFADGIEGVGLHPTTMKIA